MEKETKYHRCPVCGKPVNQKSEICQRTTAAGRKGEYRRWHRKCANAYSKRKIRRSRDDERRRLEWTYDDRLMRAWSDRRGALDSLGREIADWNEDESRHDRTIVQMVYELTRTAILMFQISPMIPLEYGDDFRRISTEIGSDGMDLISDSVRWHGARRWRDDPDVSPEGRAPRSFMGHVKEPGETLEDVYTGNVDRRETVSYETALKHIWREDNIAGGRWANDRGPWAYK